MRAAMVFADIPDDAGRLVTGNTSFYRIGIPAKYLSRRKHEIVMCYVDDLDFSNVPEVVLVERNLSTRYVDQLKMAGVKRIVVTFDDHYGLIRPTQAAYEYWKLRWADFKLALTMCNLACVPSNQLVNDFSSYCKMEYLPNYLDPEIWMTPEVAIPNPERKIIIGWGGSTGHLESWRDSGILEGIEAVQHTYPSVLLRVYTGGGEIEDMLYAHNIRFERMPWVKFKNWPAHVRSMDIGLAPLAGPYDQRRSNLKVLEFALSKVPFVCSKEPPYDHTVGSYYARNARDWAYALSRIIEQLISGKTPDDLEASQQWALGYMIDKHIDQYERILWG